MAKKEVPLKDLVESHRPKNFKYYYHFHSDDDLIQLEKDGFDISSLDTIQNSTLINEAMKATFKYYDRDIVAHAKEPTILERGVIMTKKMVTKADKKLSQVGIAFFSLNNVEYIAARFCYERFDIYEIFILT